MFSDPQSITVNAVAKSMPRIENAGRSSVYSKDDAEFQMRISHQTRGGRTRSMVRVDQQKIATDPYTAESILAKAGVWLVIDRPAAGFYNATDINYVVAALKTWLDSTNVGKLVAQES